MKSGGGGYRLDLLGGGVLVQKAWGGEGLQCRLHRRLESLISSAAIVLDS